MNSGLVIIYLDLKHKYRIINVYRVLIPLGGITQMNYFSNPFDGGRLSEKSFCQLLQLLFHRSRSNRLFLPRLKMTLYRMKVIIIENAALKMCYY